MKSKTRILASVLALLLVFSMVLTACSSGTNNAATTPTAVLTSGTEAPAAAATPDAATPDAATPAAETTTDTPKTLKKIQLVKGTGLCGIPTLIAYENGYFADEGYDVELITADSDTRKISLDNGTLPLANWDYAYFPSIENGVGIKVVDGLHRGCITIVVLEDSPVHEAADLAGKKIAIEELGSTEHQVAQVWLETNGVKVNKGQSAVKDDEVEFIPYGDGNLELEAARKGEVDAVAIWDPIGAQALEDGFRKIFDLYDTPPFDGRYCCFLMASEKILNEDPEQIASLLRAYHSAQNWINENPEAAAQLVIDKKYINVDDVALAVKLIKNYNYPTYADRAAGTAGVYEDVVYFSEKLIELGYLTSSTDPKVIADKLYAEVATNDY
ncbi:MAG: ABC transporter substrate-binding protein [Oscillospiraceae bacterium]|jgi:NitT/TauT family transport system substrate-binding protein|nr:ABC transporter substrate-binding protein [Oscillospiraceae bacterium]